MSVAPPSSRSELPVIRCRTLDGNVSSILLNQVYWFLIYLHIYTNRFRDGEEIVSGGRFKVLYEEETEAASLVIKNLALEDTGEYNIIAKNTAGTDSQFVNLTVKGSFVFLRF